MSRYFSKKFDHLEPYVPGEQPQDQKYIKLNTNESPFPTAEKARKAAAEAAENLKLYSDPDCRVLTKKLATYLGVEPECVLLSNGSDEVLNFAFMAFCDKNTPALFPDITYGFYPVFAKMNGVPYKEKPLNEMFQIRIQDYIPAEGTVFIANPNAHTGIALSRKEIEQIVRKNTDHVVVIDEAYVDFGAESAIPLTEQYENLLVVQTFSKSRSMAGARLGFCVGNRELIKDLNTLRNSTNPYNVNSMTMAAGIGALEEETYTQGNCRAIMEIREQTAEQLRKMGFTMTESISNFLFISHPELEGQWLYEELKRRGILVRHFTKERIKEYNRVTIGSREQMEIFLETIKKILQEKAGKDR